MNLNVVVCALLVTTCSVKPNMHVDIGEDPNYDGNSIADVSGLMSPLKEYVMNHKLQNEYSDISSEDYPASKRRKRSIFALGRSAVNALLKGTKQVIIDGTIIKYKLGGYQRAVDDFYSVKPSFIRRVKVSNAPDETMLSGKVGDRIIKLFKGDEGTPSYMIILEFKATSPKNKRNVIEYVD